MGRVWKRINTCIYITESLCCTPETNMILSIKSTPILNKKLKKRFYAVNNQRKRMSQMHGLTEICQEHD